jgi:hypothetical protein
LEAGDVLYVPRGWVHEVTNDDPAFSLAVVFSPPSWAVLLELLLERLAETAAFAEPLPASPFHAEEQREFLQKEMQQRLSLLTNAVAEMGVDDLIETLGRRRAIRSTPTTEPHLDSLFQLPRMSLETTLERRDVTYHLARRGDVLELILGGGYALRASARAEAALRSTLRRQDAFCVRDMHESLSESARLALARQLVSCGLLRVVGDSGHGPGPNRG